MKKIIEGKRNLLISIVSLLPFYFYFFDKPVIYCIWHIYEWKCF